MTKQPLHILQVIPYFTPQMGGSAEVAFHLSSHLAQLGHSVTVLTTNYGMESSRFPKGDFELVIIPNLTAGFGFYLSPQMIGWVKHHLKKFDLVHLHTLRTFQNAVMQHYCLKQSIPYLISAHGTTPIFMQRQLPKKIFDWIIGRKLIQHAGCMHAVSEVELEQFEQYGIPHEKIRLIPNGLDLNQGPVEPVNPAKRVGDSVIGQKILFVGRLHPIKAVDILIKALAKLPANYLHQLLIVGPDEGALSSLQTLANDLGIAERVTFTGPLYGHQKADQYRQADLVVMPSSYEIFGLVPFEALTYGKPVIVSQGTGAGCLIEKIDAGFLFPVNDENALCEQITYVIRNPAEAYAKVQRGQEYIKNHLSWTAIAYDFERLYQQLRQR